MNLTTLLADRQQAGRPIRAALIGAGKFGSMFLSQVPTIPGLEVRREMEAWFSREWAVAPLRNSPM